jgi:hypothetical protein
MKKFVLPFFSCLLVVTMLLGSFGSAKAEIGDDPVVTPVSGDMEFTTEIVPIASLPGTIELASLMLAPAGFPEGEAQFEGAGVLVTKFDTGKASACFTISGTQYGWGGKVGMWNGTKWMLLPTTITSPAETPNSIACATIAGSGTYAFIKYVVDPDKLPVFGMCTDDPQIEMLLLIPEAQAPILNFYAAILVHTPVPPVGSTISYQVLGSDPAGIVVSGLSGSGIVFATLPEDGLIGVVPPGGINDYLTIEYNPYAQYFEYVNIRVFFPDCYFDFRFTDDDFADLIGGWN